MTALDLLTEKQVKRLKMRQQLRIVVRRALKQDMDQLTNISTEVGATDIGNYADSLAESLDRQMKLAYRPENGKKLRKFGAREVAELLRMSPSNLRTKHLDGTLPEVLVEEEDDKKSRHRFYTAEDIDNIRDIMTTVGKNPSLYRPGRATKDGKKDKLQIIVVCNFKGGSGKTSTCAHLAQRWALRGYRVLAIDMDPQASLTTYFGHRPELEFGSGGTIYDALRYLDPVPLSDVIRKTYFHNLDMVPAGLMLSEYETETAAALNKRTLPMFTDRLNLALETVQDDYDLVIIDSPPQLSFITLTALTAATGLIVTVVPGMLDIASMSQFLKLASETIKAIEETIGRPVSWDFMRFLITRYEPSDGPQTQMAGYLRTMLGGNVLTEPMLKSTAISDAGMTQQTIYEVDPGQLVRKTLERALSSMNGVADELELAIQKVWGR